MSPAGGDGPPVALIVGLVFLVFPLFWIAIIGLVATTGWRRVAAAFPATSDPPLSARQFRFASLRIAGVFRSNYGACIDAWLTDYGLWLRPILPFRPFHPMIFLPWARVESVEAERVFGFEHFRVRLAGALPDLYLAGALGRAVLAHRRA